MLFIALNGDLLTQRLSCSASGQCEVRDAGTQIKLKRSCHDAGGLAARYRRTVYAGSKQSKANRQSTVHESDSPAELIREIRQLADRVGGIDKLRELIEEVAKLRA